MQFCHVGYIGFSRGSGYRAKLEISHNDKRLGIVTLLLVHSNFNLVARFLPNF